MHIFLEGKTGIRESELVRKFGYHFYTDPFTGGRAYVRRLREGSRYPRFHLSIHPMIKNGASGAMVDIHYDWRKPLHKKFANSSEDEGDIVSAEIERVKKVWENLCAH